MRRRLLAAVVLATAGAAVFFGWRSGDPARDAPEFRIVHAVRGDLRVTAVATGIVQPQNRLEVKPPIAGRIEEILVREGDRVEKGAVLAWMSSVERAALLDVARSKGSEELAHWREIYKPAPLLAPLRGMVIARNVEPGQSVAADEAVFVLSDRLIVKAQVDETDIGRIRIGADASVTLDAYPETPVASRVDHVAYEAKTVNNVTIYEVDVLPAEVPDVMRSGMTANVTFLVAEREAAILLPAEAIEGKGETATVRVPSPRGPHTRPVDVGLTNGQDVEILAGLAEGDEVLVPVLRMPAATSSGSNPFFPSPPRRGRDTKR